MQNHVQYFKKDADSIEQCIHDSHRAMKRLYVQIVSLKETHTKQAFFDKVKSFFSYSKKLNHLQQDVHSEQVKIESYNARLSKAKAEMLKNLVSDCFNQYPEQVVLATLFTKYNMARQLAESSNKLLALGKMALIEVSEADSAVSSAQAMEVFDMFSSNKAISVVSTVSSASASSEMGDAKSVIHAFTSALGKHKELTDGIDSSLTLEWVDLWLDLSGVNNGFDFSSVMSYFALSSASSSLSDVNNRLKKVVPGIADAADASSVAYATVAAELEALKLAICRPALDTLLASGVEVTEPEFQSVVTAMSIHEGGL
jgi:hypothetical protein